ncbi:MAG: cyclic nucleotide-binding domain-containing protein [bacterium]
MKLTDLLKNLLLDKDIKRKVRFLSGISIFKKLNMRLLGKLINITYSKTYQKGETIFNEGDIGKAIFIVERGNVEITKKVSEKEEGILVILGPGDFFGEMALLEELPRSATARAIEESEIYIIYKVNFDALIDKHPQVGLQIVRNLASILSKRLRKTSEQVTAQIIETLSVK